MAKDKAIELTLINQNNINQPSLSIEDKSENVTIYPAIIGSQRKLEIKDKLYANRALLNLGKCTEEEYKLFLELSDLYINEENIYNYPKALALYHYADQAAKVNNLLNKVEINGLIETVFNKFLLLIESNNIQSKSIAKTRKIHKFIKDMEKESDLIGQFSERIGNITGNKHVENILKIMPDLIKQGAYLAIEFENDVILHTLSEYLKGNKENFQGSHHKIRKSNLINTFENISKAIDKSLQDNLVKSKEQKIKFIKSYCLIADVVADEYLSNYKEDRAKLARAKSLLDKTFSYLCELGQLPNPNQEFSSDYKVFEEVEKCFSEDKEFLAITARIYYLLGREYFSPLNKEEKYKNVNYAKSCFEISKNISEAIYLADDGDDNRVTLEAMLSRRNGLLYLKINEVEDLLAKPSLHQEDSEKIKKILIETKKEYRKLREDSRSFYNISSKELLKLRHDVLHYSECSSQIAAACILEVIYYKKCGDIEAATKSAAEAMQVLTKSDITFAPLTTTLFDNEKRLRVYVNQFAKLTEAADYLPKNIWNQLCIDNLSAPDDNTTNKIWNLELKKRICSEPPINSAKIIYEEVIKQGPKSKSGVLYVDRAHSEAQTGIERLSVNR